MLRAASDTAAIESLKRGQLPFVGRHVDLERIMRFWAETLEAETLRVSLVIGEAGIGKTRLLECAAERIAARGGVVVQTRLYPDSSIALHPNLATALWSSESCRHLLRHEPEATLGGISEALRRLTRLRPTIIIIEDVHLLSNEAAREMSLLLDAIADETLSIVCAMRPIDVAARSALQRFVVEQIEMQGLTADELDELWSMVSGERESNGIGTILEHATLGNPLAVRAALCHAAASTAGTTRLVDAVRESVNQSVDILAEGMIVGLRDDEIDAGCRLAVLGEAFVPSAAGAILGDAAHMLERLRERGIIARVAIRTAPLPEPRRATDERMPQRDGDTAFAFTHSLTHRHLLERAVVPVEDVLRALVAADRIYSTVPFRYITQRASDDVNVADAESVMSRALAIAREMHTTPDWITAPVLVDAAKVLLASIESQLTEASRRELHAALLVARLALLSRQDYDEEFGDTARQLLALTDRPESDAMARYHLVALRARAIEEVRREDGDYHSVWESADAFVAQHPGVRSTSEHVSLMQWLLGYSVMMEDMTLARSIERRVKSIIADESIGIDERRAIEDQLSPYYLAMFETESELAAREEQYARVNDPVSANDMTRVMIGNFRYLTGNARETIELCKRDLAYQSERGLWRNAYSCQLLELASSALLGADLIDLLDRADRICASYPELEPEFRASVPWYLTGAFLLRDDAAAIDGLVSRFDPPDYLFSDETKMLIAIARDDAAAELGRLSDAPPNEPAIQLHALIAVRSPENARKANELLRAALSTPAIGTQQVLHIRWALGLADVLHARGDCDTETQQRCTATVEHMLEWMAERKLSALMPPCIARYGKWLAEKSVASWNARASVVERESRALSVADSPRGPLRIFMLGEASSQVAGGDRTKLRGGRIVTLLGLMIANEIVKSPLSHREFRTLAAGGEIEQDPERARKTMNMAVLRLREAIGYDAVLTDRETPRLNLGNVSVDLLEARDMIGSAREALREGALARSHGPLMRALEISGGDVPFPGLYDEFFEALREDFETGLRSIVVDVATKLLREGDNTRAEEILARAFRAMPDDGEIGELLEQTLIALNRRSDAARVRMRTAAAGA